MQDKLWLPGMLKLKTLRDTGFFGEILSVRGEFGYWVFEGDTVSGPAALLELPQRRWRRRHHRHALPLALRARQPVRRSEGCLVPRRDAHQEALERSGSAVRLHGRRLGVCHIRAASGVIAHFNSSWCVRVRRDDLLTMQVDGTSGTAVAGLRDCWVQPYGATPRPTWNPDIESPFKLLRRLAESAGAENYDNAFKRQWELYLKHIVKGGPFPWDLLRGRQRRATRGKGHRVVAEALLGRCA